LANIANSQSAIQEFLPGVITPSVTFLNIQSEAAVAVSAMRAFNMSRTKILLVDDHDLVREGIRSLLQNKRDLKIVGEAGSGEEAVKLAGELLPDVIIMDISMPGMGGLEATKEIKAKHPAIAVLILTVHDEEEYIMGLLTAGAAGYLLKGSCREKLVKAVQAIAQGEFVCDKPAYQTIIKYSAFHRTVPANRVERLTPRETQVLQLAAEGMSNEGIAARLEISTRTVKGHMLNVFDKLQVRSRTEAVLAAIRNGWVRF